MRTAFRLFLAFASLCLVGALCTGCGSKGPRLTPVEGVVTLDGEALEGAVVLFEPEAGGRPATGVTDAQGKFVLKTLEEGDGARVGMNLVSVAKQAKVETGVQVEEGEILPVQFETPVKYASPKTSGLKVDVQPGMEPAKLELVSQ